MRFIILFLSFLPLYTIAQDKFHGVISYEETIKINISIEGIDEAILDRIPKSRTLKKELLFNNNKTLYKRSKSIDGVPDEFSAGGRRMVRMRGGDNVIFKDLTEMIILEQKSFMGKTFLIRENYIPKWKITAEQKEILGYNCQKAILHDTTRSVEVFFTMDIPVSSGPDVLAGLPGLILEASINEGKRLITATSIEFEMPEDEIGRPTKGEEVTREEFREIVKEKMEEMKEMNGGNNRFIIRDN